MLSTLIQQKVEERFGRPIRYAKDCDTLSLSIFAFTKQKISCTTLKRLFGIIEADSEPRLYTLDVVANYLGYINYDHLLQAFNPNYNKELESIQTLNSRDLNSGEILVIKYAPSISISLQCNEQGHFDVKESSDPKIQEGALLVFNSIARNMPIFASSKASKQSETKNIVLAKISGVTSIERI